MLKFVVFASVLFASAFATYDAYHNMIGYDAPLPMRRSFSPYGHHRQFQDNRQSRVVQPFYEGFLLPMAATAAVTDVAVTKFGIMAQIATFGLSLAKTFIAFILSNGLALVMGSLGVLGVCKFTPICDKLSSFQSIVDLQRDLTHYATPERIASAAEFVQKTIRDYRSTQDKV